MDRKRHWQQNLFRSHFNCGSQTNRLKKKGTSEIIVINLFEMSFLFQFQIFDNGADKLNNSILSFFYFRLVGKVSRGPPTGGRKKLPHFLPDFVWC